MKERIIGAVVIVLFVVLVVPVFLDGRSGTDEIVSERVPLPGQSEQKSQTVVLARDRDDPVPAAATSSKAVVAEAPASVADTPKTAVEVAPQEVEAKPVEEKPAPRKAPAPEPQPERPEPAEKVASNAVANVSTTGMWAVQLGAFSDQAKAERLAADLRKQGFAAFQSPVATADGRMVRVRVGPQKDRDSAEAMAERLAKTGRQGRVVPHP